jgi:signal transduction histidine kinase/ligand-binding sensor domain-containing protein
MVERTLSLPSADQRQYLLRRSSRFEGATVVVELESFDFEMRMKKTDIYGVPGSESDFIQSRLRGDRCGIDPLLRGIAMLCLLFIGFLTGHAQFRSTQWTADSGLPQNIIRGIVQTPDGYMWVATLNGVARFDGVRFTIFDKGNTPGIAANRFVSMVKGVPGDLWLYTENGAVTRRHQNEFRTLGEAEGIPIGYAEGLTSDNHGNVWVLRDDHILRWNDALNRFEPVAGNNNVRYRGLNWVGTGFWGTRGQDLYCFVHGKFSVQTVPAYLSLADVHKVAVGADGAIWIELPKGRFARFFEGKWEVHTEPVVTAFGGSRTSWRASIDNRLDRTLFFPSGESEKGIRYNMITDDSERNTWVGSEGQGLYRIQQQTIHVYSVAQGLAGPNVYPVLRDSRGDMWIGTWPAGLTQYHDGALKTYTQKDGLPGLVTALAEDEAGDIWVGTHSGVAVLSQGHFRVPKDLPPDLPDVQAILKMRDGGLLLGSQRGIYKYSETDSSRSSSWVEPQGVGSLGDIRVMIEGGNGDLWFGGYDGLTRMHNGVLTRWTEREGLPSNNVRSIYEDAEGVLWVGTYDGGLGRYSDGRWTRYTQKDGLFDNGVFQILEDSRANLWMSSNRGIYRVSKKQLNDFAAGLQRSLITVSYGRSDGMQNAECNGGLWPAGAKDKNGKLWFPTQDGVAVVDPEFVPVNQKSPQVVIESADLDHTPANLEKSITVAPGRESLEIQYTALSFSRPEQITFRYMMEGLDTNWQEVGYRRTAYFSHLPPGNYTFRVMAANSDGIWSTTQSSLPVTVLPPFYLTRWFLLSICALAFGVLYLLWGFRVRQLKSMQAAQQAFSQQLIASQESERRRISGELHDSLGQRLIIIKNHALFLLRPRAASQTEEERRQTIEDISSEASLAIDETRTISYDLRPFQLDRLGLSKAIEALIRSASRATGISFTTHIADIDSGFPEALRINFYRIVQEAVNNIMKHSGASEAEIKVIKTNRGILLSIRDNGVGLSSQQKIAGAGKGGFGLIGIKERALLLGGTVEIGSQPGVGTLLTINFDLKRHHPS